jgi:hypothetical protein
MRRYGRLCREWQHAIDRADNPLRALDGIGLATTTTELDVIGLWFRRRPFLMLWRENEPVTFARPINYLTRTEDVGL